MRKRTVAPNKVRGPNEVKGPLIKMTAKAYYAWLLREEVREAAAKRGIEIVDEPRVGPRLVAERSSAEVLLLSAAKRSEP
jgi:hypothetical protein